MFRTTSVHTQEFCGIYSCIHISSLLDVRVYLIHQIHPNVEQTAYMDAWKKYRKNYLCTSS
jgi:hypothetical protein